ncbi:MAG: hypothetical protein RL756_1913, partial [Pseudomonadota bacterium]
NGADIAADLHPRVQTLWTVTRKSRE